MVRPAGPPIGPDPDIALGEGVYATIVNGQPVVTNGELITIDERAVAREAHRLTEELVSRSRA